MTTVAIVYHSATGRTKALAEAVARGVAKHEGTTAQLLAIEEGAAIHAFLAAADAIVFGCPTYMGSVSGAFKTFMDGTSAIWALQGWRDKLAAAFTHSAAPSGDKLGTLTQLVVFAAQHGMVWIGLGLPPTYAGAATEIEDTNRLGSHLGAMAQSRPGAGAVPAGDLRTAELLGQRVAEAAERWEKGRPETPVGPTRHETARSWVFPAERRGSPGAGIERTNLRELVARPERFEHHLVVCASIDGAQLEVTAASEPLYFAHINFSDEYVVALPSGDDLVDRFPLRTFISDPETGEDVGRYNHRVGDIVLHPESWLHWPGRLRPPYEPFDFPPGMRRTGLSLVYCANRATPGAPPLLSVPPERQEDVKAYRASGAPLSLGALRVDGQVAAVGTTTLSLVCRPSVIAPPRGGWVLVLESDRESTHAACDLYRIAEGAAFDGAGIVRALVFASPSHAPDGVPASWAAPPRPSFAPYEEGPSGTLPFDESGLTVREHSPTMASVTTGNATIELPRYWLARMLYRVLLHDLRLGYIETYGGFFVDERGSGPVQIGIRNQRGRQSASIPRAGALAFVERLYRAVAPPGYVERIH